MSAYGQITAANFGTIQDAVKAAFKGETVLIKCGNSTQADQVKKMIACSFPYIKQELIQVAVEGTEADV